MFIEAGGAGQGGNPDVPKPPNHESSNYGPIFDTKEEVLYYEYTRLTGYLDLVGEKPSQGPPTQESIEDLMDHVGSIGANPELVIGHHGFRVNIHLSDDPLTPEEMERGRELFKKIHGFDIFDIKFSVERIPESNDPPHNL